MADLDNLDEEFSSVDAGASQTIPCQCSSLRKNGFVCIKGRACKIVEMSTSKTGKHGHAKVHMVGIDIFTSKKYEDICPSTHNMDVPVVQRKDYQLVDVLDDGTLSVMDDDGNTRDDLNLPPGDLGKDIKDRFEKGETFTVTVIKAMGEEQITGTKTLS
ncbi:eukaryotic translation initiation factor 5A-1-like [Crassostrea virginica]|nr:eukaryotic translation initiation factor 5A-1-like isoform X2 [Crassostrea virginica]XP_022343389.1 eukaryotic translation initiation factor 5A-1-like isoform X2 [Crassostrea virginica]|mmetsp:Transcript_27736/g.44394  ORF Transcript_27736/g.44394 Transcript_27736/m.44394 type:complete len:159 (+) Transcript_27736:35-511(+)